MLVTNTDRGIQLSLAPDSPEQRENRVTNVALRSLRNMTRFLIVASVMMIAVGASTEDGIVIGLGVGSLIISSLTYRCCFCQIP